MLRRLFRCVLLLHPPYFRRRFSEEMLSIFDHAADSWAELLLVIDGLVSAARQWGFRPEFLDEFSAEQPLVPDGVPSFYTVPPFHPRTPAVIHGMLLSLALFCLTCVGIRYSWMRILQVHIPSVQFDEPIAPPQASPSRGNTTLSTSPVLLAPEHAAPIALPPPTGASVSPLITPRAITIQKRSLKGISQSEGPLRLSLPASSTESFVEVALQDYAGTYVVPSGGPTILVSVEGGCLMMKVAGQPKLALTPVSETKFTVAATDDWVEFVEEESTGRNAFAQLRLFQSGQLLIAQRQ